MPWNFYRPQKNSFIFYLVHPKTTQSARPQYNRNVEQQMLLHMLLFKTKKKHKRKQNKMLKQKRNMKQYRDEGIWLDEQRRDVGMWPRWFLNIFLKHLVSQPLSINQVW